MKAFSFFAFMLVGTSVLVGVQTNSYGMQVTKLNGDLTATATTITVESTTNFNDSGVIWIDTEQIGYSYKTATTFGDGTHPCVRGRSNSEATVHKDDATVSADDAGELTQMFAFDIGSLFDQWGLFAFPVMIINFFRYTIPAMVQGNMFNLFQGNGLGLIVVLWLTMGSGFIFMIFMYLFTARRGGG